MKIPLLAVLVLSGSLVWGDSNRQASAVAVRALPNAPDGYAPSNVSCPAGSARPGVRSAASLSPSESSWLDERRPKSLAALKGFFGRVSLGGGFDAVSYLDSLASGNGSNSSLPTIGIAISGGGYRSLMTGAGVVKAFDSRTPNATSAGQLGGLLQSATYVAGLSGGSWLVGSIFVNNFSTIDALQTTQPGTVWQFGNSIFVGPDAGGIQILDSASYYADIEQAVASKAHAGFSVTITDYWSRALSYQMVNATNGGPSYTWSSIALMPEFQHGDYPMPLVVADGRYPNELVVGGNATVYEFNPWEFGTFDPTIFGFVPLEYLGSLFVDGRVPDNASCVRGFDNAGYVMGTSSSLFNEFFLKANSSALPQFIQSTLTDILGTIGNANLDIAEYKPNPFYGYRSSNSAESFPYAGYAALDLVDGGEDGQNIPLHPLIQPERHVDVIFAVDSSADTSYNWPNGSSLVATYQRSLNATGIANGTAFPAIPDQNTFINLGLNTRPTFFGCNASNTTSTSATAGEPAPLIVYLPNSPYTTFSNVSTFDPSYNDSQRDAIILNGYDLATLANSSRDANWTACVGCAILSRSFDRTATPVPDICAHCFAKYCWDGSLNSSVPAAYDPSPVLSSVNSTSGAAAARLVLSRGCSGLPLLQTLVAVALGSFVLLF